MINPLIENSAVYSIILGLSSFALTLTYITTKVPNFTYGIFLLLGTYITFTLGAVISVNPYYSIPLSFLLGAVVGLGQYLGIMRPLLKRKSNIITQMVVTFSFSIFMYGILNAYASYLTTAYKVQSRDVTLSYLDFSVYNIKGDLLVSTILGIVTIFGFYILLFKTKLGISIRATVENAALSETLGVNTELVYAISWALSGGVASAAGSLYPLQFVFSPYLAYSVLLSIFAGSVLGGLNSLYGGFIGGFIEGIIEKYVMAEIATYVAPSIGVSSYLITQYATLVPLVIVVIVLLFFPRGLSSFWVK